jgi:hypothetical protein
LCNTPLVCFRELPFLPSGPPPQIQKNQFSDKQGAPHNAVLCDACLFVLITPNPLKGARDFKTPEEESRRDDAGAHEIFDPREKLLGGRAVGQKISACTFSKSCGGDTCERKKRYAFPLLLVAIFRKKLTSKAGMPPGGRHFLLSRSPLVAFD